MSKPRYIATAVELPKGKITVYASPRISAALKDVADQLNLYQGVKLIQVLEAVYAQGKKDGARQAFDATSKSLQDARKEVPYANPGRPKKK